MGAGVGGVDICSVRYSCGLPSSCFVHCVFIYFLLLHPVPIKIAYAGCIRFQINNAIHLAKLVVYIVSIIDTSTIWRLRYSIFIITFLLKNRG